MPAGAAVLDVGCGEGYYLGSLARERGVEAHGVDLSAAAIDLAARRYPEATWVVANADRSLPYATGAFDLVLSIDARLNPAEMRRVLKPGGRLLVAVPASGRPRRAARGRARRGGRYATAWRGPPARLAADFELEARRTVRDTRAARVRRGRATPSPPPIAAAREPAGADRGDRRDGR